MIALELLKQGLQKVARNAFNDINCGDPQPMSRVRADFKKRFGGFGAGGDGEHSTFALAVRRYRGRGELSNFRDTRDVCFGCTSIVDADNYRLISDTKLFVKLLGRAGAFREEPRKFLRCYQGLLFSYFSYPGLESENSLEKKNWLRLRDYLDKNLSEVLQYGTSTLSWISVLEEHRNLLKDDPCDRYGEAYLRGEKNEFDSVKEELSLSEDSWIVKEAIISPINAAARLDDGTFCGHIKPLLDWIEPYDVLRNRGLAKLLTRYHDCEQPVEQEDLRDFSLRHWKNPWLNINKTYWDSWVEEPVRKMVEHWLKLRSIEDFFALLAEDGGANRRRLEFWLRYVSHIGDMYFALGRNARFNNTPDYKKLKERMLGRLMHLENTTAQNNAFLMHIGNYVFIEFGEHGNACHVFEADNMPFQLGKRSVSGNSLELKNIDHSGHKLKLTHHGDWEDDFASAIAKLTGIRFPTRTRAEAHPRSRLDSSRIANRHRVVPRFSGEQFFLFVKKFNLSTKDNRAKGGALWVDTDDKDEEVVATLTAWGFRYKKSKASWWKM